MRLAYKQNEFDKTEFRNIHYVWYDNILLIHEEILGLLKN